MSRKTTKPFPCPLLVLVRFGIFPMLPGSICHLHQEKEDQLQQGLMSSTGKARGPRLMVMPTGSEVPPMGMTLPHELAHLSVPYYRTL